MSGTLRIEMIVISIAFLIMVIRTINRKRLWLQYAFIWIFMAIGMILISMFPNLAIKFSNIANIEVPSNFIYLLGLLVLLVLTFSLSIIVSKQSQEIKKLIQIISIEKYLREDNKEGEN